MYIHYEKITHKTKQLKLRRSVQSFGNYVKINCFDAHLLKVSILIFNIFYKRNNVVFTLIYTYLLLIIYIQCIKCKQTNERYTIHCFSSSVSVVVSLISWSKVCVAGIFVVFHHACFEVSHQCCQ